MRIVGNRNHYLLQLSESLEIFCDSSIDNENNRINKSIDLLAPVKNSSHEDQSLRQ